MRLAVIGGDGIGPEVTAEALKVLRACRDDIDTTDYDLGARRYLATGELLTDDDLRSLKEHDAILHWRAGRGTAWGVRARLAAHHAVRPRPSRESAAGKALPHRHLAAGEPR